MNTAYTGEKKNLGFWQIWNMCFGFFGIQFGWSLQMNNMSAIYEFLGAKPDQIPGLWLAAPMTGLLIQPIIGYWSDRTWHPKLGRRRPFFLVGAILSSLLLFLLPSSPVVWMAAGMLWILDSSINVTMEPFRAFVADNLNEKQRSFGFSMQSMFIGLASFIAGYLPQLLVNWFHISRHKVNGIIPDKYLIDWFHLNPQKVKEGLIPQNILLSFYMGAAVFFVAVMYTILRSKEYPPTAVTNDNKDENKVSIFSEIFSSIKNMPIQMKRLALVNFITWPGLFLMWFYYSTGVATQLFHGDAVTNSNAYTMGLEHANTTSAILNLVTFGFSFTLPFWVGLLGKKYTHTMCLLLGGIGLISVYFITNVNYLFVSMGLVGIAWASILSMPYSMLAGFIPEKKMGIYMGIFNFFIVLPEIIASLFFGKIMSNYLHDDRLLAVLIGGVLLIFASLVCMTIIKEEKPS
jgi:maltose/moltooligosaccharide transporter